MTAIVRRINLVIQVTNAKILVEMVSAIVVKIIVTAVLIVNAQELSAEESVTWFQENAVVVSGIKEPTDVVMTMFVKAMNIALQVTTAKINVGMEFVIMKKVMLIAPLIVKNQYVAMEYVILVKTVFRAHRIVIVVMKKDAITIALEK
jgi:hypothetical protein